MTSESMKAPRDFSKGMTDKMYAIAARNGGEVPLHGRMFAQWLHYAFPHECPYPHVVDSDTKVLDPVKWVVKDAQLASETEREVHRNAIHDNITYAVLAAQS